MRHGQHVHEAKPTIEAPGVLPDATDRVKGILDNYSMRVPESVRSAQEGAQLLVAEASQVTPDNTAGGGYKYAGTSSVRAEAAEQLLSVAERGIDYWRLTPAEKEGWQKVLDASHPSQVPPELKQVLRAVKPDVMMPDAMALSILKQKQAGPRIKLAEQIEEKDRIETSKAEYRARGEQQASQWTASVERGRSLRERADKRVEGILYKLKLENGGEIAFSKDPGLRERLRQQAVVMAETEGHRTGHLKKRHYEVPEAHSTTQQETVNALREFWSASGKKANVPDPNASPNSAATPSQVIDPGNQAPRPAQSDLDDAVRNLYISRGSSAEDWDALSDEDRGRAISRAMLLSRKNARTESVSKEDWDAMSNEDKLRYLHLTNVPIRIITPASQPNQGASIRIVSGPGQHNQAPSGKEGRKGKLLRPLAAAALGIALVGGAMYATHEVTDNHNSTSVSTEDNGGDNRQDDIVKQPADTQQLSPEIAQLAGSEYPWTVAEHFTPGHGMETVREGIAMINKDTGSNYYLQRVGGSLQVYQNGRALNPTQQATFNLQMVELLGLAD